MKHVALWTIFAATLSYSAEVLTPQEYQFESLPKKTSEPWLCLTSTELRKCELTLKKRVMGDEDILPGAVYATVSSNVKDTKFIFRGVSELKPHAISGIDFIGSKLFEIKKIPIKISGFDMQFETTVIYSEKKDETTKPIDFSFTVRLGSESIPLEPAAKTLDDAEPQLYWVGDLNNDGIPDLILNAYAKYSASAVELMLSRKISGKVSWKSIVYRITPNSC